MDFKQFLRTRATPQQKQKIKDMIVQRCREWYLSDDVDNAKFAQSVIYYGMVDQPDKNTSHLEPEDVQRFFEAVLHVPKENYMQFQRTLERWLTTESPDLSNVSDASISSALERLYLEEHGQLHPSLVRVPSQIASLQQALLQVGELLELNGTVGIEAGTHNVSRLLVHSSLNFKNLTANERPIRVRCDGTERDGEAYEGKGGVQDEPFATLIVQGRWQVNGCVIRGGGLHAVAATSDAVLLLNSSEIGGIGHLEGSEFAGRFRELSEANRKFSSHLQQADELTAAGDEAQHPRLWDPKLEEDLRSLDADVWGILDNSTREYQEAEKHVMQAGKLLHPRFEEIFTVTEDKIDLEAQFQEAIGEDGGPVIWEHRRLRCKDALLADNRASCILLGCLVSAAAMDCGPDAPGSGVRGLEEAMVEVKRTNFSDMSHAISLHDQSKVRALWEKDRTGPDRTGQDRTGQDRTGQDRTGCEGRKGKRGKEMKGKEKRRG
ncbi:hypothetical protein GUITHDRAFT_121375 [Guillardia theta CCMP2712]|uniref:Uncharacterized protein n=1 Tax=Guillardia theta (strain CCMP2712) TaxID=905079 RepID=L1I9B2_GUITC|nr:hypothetical protein GUITHDRAFT_121375 [Guillardia theta CCMP2712]EKX32445.1 hypothetical protein GUITHDRAFT_121375 [Guillardia theta CCMP2712]|eukprot:XP_005819425.1 hypothetical protein GUITHDRAFT_121375 [Guillardia theta CCMP2712]